MTDVTDEIPRTCTFTSTVLPGHLAGDTDSSFQLFMQNSDGRRTLCQQTSTAFAIMYDRKRNSRNMAWCPFSQSEFLLFETHLETAIKSLIISGISDSTAKSTYAIKNDPQPPRKRSKTIRNNFDSRSTLSHSQGSPGASWKIEWDSGVDSGVGLWTWLSTNLQILRTSLKLIN